MVDIWVGKSWWWESHGDDFTRTDRVGVNSVEVAEQNGTAAVTLCGEFDLSLATSVRLRFDELKGDVEADCAGVTFMDCSGVNVMIEMNQQCHARSAKLTVVNPPPCVTRLLSLTRLDGVLDIRSRVPGG